MDDYRNKYDNICEININNKKRISKQKIEIGRLKEELTYIEVQRLEIKTLKSHNVKQA